MPTRHVSVWEKCPAVTLEKMVQPLPKLRNFWNTQQVGPPCKLLPFQGNCRVRKKAMVFTCISACHAAHRGCSQPRGFHSVGKTRGTMASTSDGFGHDSTTLFSQGLSCVQDKNPQDHSYSRLEQHAALDPKQHSSSTTWGWRGHCWDRAPKPPLHQLSSLCSPTGPAKQHKHSLAAAALENGSPAAHPLVAGCLLGPMADNIPAKQAQNNEKHFPKLAEMGFIHISDFQSALFQG